MRRKAARLGAARIGAAAAGLAVLAGCAPAVDPGRLALCREVLPALHEEATALRETRRGPAGEDGTALRIDYTAERPGRARTTHYVVCRFDGRDGQDRPDLAGLTTERGPYPAVRFAILKRWWLGQAVGPWRGEPGRGPA